MVTVQTRIADLNISFKSTYYYINAICRPYYTDFTKPDVEIEICEDEAMKAYEDGLKQGLKLGPGYYEGIIGFRKLSAKLADFNAFVLHGATFAVDESGVIFCALSGTGKTTHMMLWQKLLGERFRIINGDKPIVRFFDDTPFAYGTPWNGKEHLGGNDKVQLKKICFIERSETNSVSVLDRAEATKRLSFQMVQPDTPSGILSNMKFIEKLLDSCEVYVIKCNMNPEAANVAYDFVF